MDYRPFSVFFEASSTCVSFTEVKFMVVNRASDAEHKMIHTAFVFELHKKGFFFELKAAFSRMFVLATVNKDFAVNDDWCHAIEFEVIIL